MWTLVRGRTTSYITLLVAVLVVVTLNSTLVPAAPAEKVFRYNFSYDSAGARLDIGKGYTILGPNLFIGLTLISPENKIIPGAAERWDVSRDRLTYTFHLRRDMEWSDGQPVTARDFEFGWKRALDPATASVRAWMLYIVRGAEAYNTGTGSRDDVAVRAIDDYTLVVSLVRPAEFFPAYIAANNVYFAEPRHVIEKVGNAWTNAANIVFSGPFKITRYVPNSLVVMEPNPGWPLKKPTVTRVEQYIVPSVATGLAEYEAGELDYAAGLPVGEIKRIRNDPRLKDQYALLPASRVAVLEFNVQKAPWNNTKIRQAFSRAVDQEELTGGPFQRVYRPALSLRPPGMPGADLNYLRQVEDPVRARALLSEAGYPEGKGFPEVTLLVRNEADDLTAAQYLQQRFARVLGVRINVRVMEFNAMFDIISRGRGEMWIAADFSLSPDLYDLYNVVEGRARNYSHLYDSHFSNLLRRAASEADPAKRLALYDEAERYLVVERAVSVPLWFTDQPSLISPRVEGLREDKRNMWSYTWELIDIGK